MKWEKRAHEYDDIAKKITREENKFYIWGWGIVGKTFYEKFQGSINFIGIIDKNEEKWGEQCDNLSVISPDRVKLGKNEKIVITTGWVNEVKNTLENQGYKYREDFFLIDEFSSIYEFYVHDNLHLENVAIVCNEKCTLRCEKCVSLIPYNKHQINYSFDEMCKSSDLLFNWVDSIGILALGGGDVILNPHLSKFIDYLGKKYIRRIGRIELYMNAIILPSTDLIELCKKYNIVIRFTDYSQNVPGVQRISEILELCKNNEICCEHVKFANWVDTGYPQESNGITSDNDLIAHCQKCSPVICSTVIHNKLFYCSPSAMAFASGLFEEDRNDYFDLEDFSQGKRSELLEFYNGYSAIGYPSYCKRCNGLFNTNKNLIEVAVQLRNKINENSNF